MKILLFNLNASSGMLHYSSQFANALAKKHEVVVVLPEYSDDSLYDSCIGVIRIRAPPNVRGTVWATIDIPQHIDLIRQIKQFNPDVVHMMDNHPWYIFYSVMFATKLFVTQHDPQLHMGDLKGFHRNMTHLTNEWLRVMCKKLFVHGQSTKDSIKDIPKEKIVPIPHGDYNIFNELDNQEEEICSDVLFFGRILPYKGVDLLIEAASHMHNYNFVIAGEGDIGVRFLPPNVQLINRFISEQEVGRLFRGTKLVVLPYREATQTGVIPLAYSFKKPVVASMVGALPEAIKGFLVLDGYQPSNLNLQGTTGLMVPPNNVQKLVKALDLILTLSEQDREKMGENAYQFMKDNLSWESITDKVELYYKHPEATGL